MRCKQIIKSVAFIALFVFMCTAELQAARIERTLDDGWRFAKGEQPLAVQQPDYDDTQWDEIRLPHDWAITGPFNPSESGYAGKLPWRGVGWYRKTIELESRASGAARSFWTLMA